MCVNFFQLTYFFSILSLHLIPALLFRKVIRLAAGMAPSGRKTVKQTYGRYLLQHGAGRPFPFPVFREISPERRRAYRKKAYRNLIGYLRDPYRIPPA
jgi:hypothetical protein